jgi:ATP-binding protein involved in chromosome partitioning
MMNDEQQRSIELENQRIEHNINRIKHRLVVFSGKGGVGKTTVSVNLAFAFQLIGYKTGILDADITGPNVPKMIGVSGDLLMENNQIIPRIHHGVKVVSMANLLMPEQAVIWRGPLRSKVINQFLGDVNWGELDYLIADLPPGTGDEILTIAQKMKPDMAIIVTTPQEISLTDSRRAITMAKKMQIPKICLIENMSGLHCPNCNHLIEIFGSGGGKRQAQETCVEFLGEIPMSLETRKLADDGKAIIIENQNADISRTMLQIVKKIRKLIEEGQHTAVE